MSYEEKLDFVLKRLYEKSAFYMPEIILCDYLSPNVSQNEFQEFKHKLISDGYLQQDPDQNSLGAYQASFSTKYKYSITSKGRHLVESGEGYVARKSQEKLILKITKNSYTINTWVLILSIISILLAIIALFR
ncbi:MAG: hypothetical protein EOP53_02010 [Sphingobacteriales bacterium]|nr:MAG: hypothetical protein EOP53_02010 [Sphingobacteriales bacterium]